MNQEKNKKKDDIKTQEEKEISNENFNEKKENDFLREELSSLKNDKIFLAADIENLKKSNLREKSEIIKFSNQKIILKFIPLLDNYELALKVSKTLNDEKVNKFFSGISMAIEEFKKCLKSEGVEIFPIELGKDIWDSEFCQVVDEIENDEFESGTIVDIVNNGYLLNGRMIRPALVVISKKSNKNK